MTGSDLVPPRLSRVFDTVVTASGMLLALGALLALLVEPAGLALPLLLGAPLIMVMAWFPMVIGRSGSSIEVGFDSCVLIFLVCVTDPIPTLVIWSVGSVLGQLTTSKRSTVKAFNIGLSVLCGAVAIFVLSETRTALSRPGELVAVALACAAYFVADFVFSAVSVALEERSSIRTELSHPGVPTALAIFVAIDSIGYLAALVVRTLPEWSMLLLAVPLATILVAARAKSRGDEHGRRLQVLFGAAVRVQGLTDQTSVLNALHEGAQDLLRDPQVELRRAPPTPGQIGAAVRGGAEELWVVGPARDRARSTAVADQQALIALVAVAEEAFSRLRLLDDMAHLAQHDALTGLPNRSLLLDRVEHALVMQRRRRGRLAVLFCDLDGFKRVNDRFGHAAGDELLREVAHRIMHCLRDTDTVARLGGDEFAVLIEAIEDVGEIHVACERLLEALRAPINIGGNEVSISTSIGVAMSERGDNADALLRNADMAMYHAKARGKDRYETYRISLGDERLRRIEMVEALRQAVDKRDFEVHYQPVVDLRTREVQGVEALVRWRRDGVIVPPDDFIALAEESGVIVALGELVLDLAAADAPQLKTAVGGPLTIGVNVSAQQLRADAFADRVRQATSAMGAGVALVLEVTERDFVGDDDDTALAVMSELAEEDVRFAVDDFGVGFSSIGYLQRLPVRILKIDRSFVVKVEDDPRASSLVRSMVLMGQGLGLDVVVEGVERDSQLAVLVQEVGVTIGQGFLLGRPQPLAGALKTLRAAATLQPRLPEQITHREAGSVVA